MKNDFFEELDKNDTSKLSNETYESILNRTERNINYFLKLANIIKIICVILAIIIFASGLDTVNENIILFVSFLIVSVIFVLIGILSTPFLEWKAYTLKNLYEINKKERKK